VALLELREVEAGYGSIQILHGVSLHVDPGEVVAVIGPNGAGKSTAFKVIMGLITHLGGEMRFDGHDLIGRARQVLGFGLGRPPGRVVFTGDRASLQIGAYLRAGGQNPAGDGARLLLFPRLGGAPPDSRR
jgi:branched-chain amino acid transport system ATP-binding protein